MPDDFEIEPTHAAADYHGYDLGCTDVYKLMADQALGFATAGAMCDDDC